MMKCLRKVVFILMVGIGFSLSVCDMNFLSSFCVVEVLYVYCLVEVCVVSEVYILDQCELFYQEVFVEYEQGVFWYNICNLCEQEFGGGLCVSCSIGSGLFWFLFFVGWVMLGVVDCLIEECDC